MTSNLANQAKILFKCVRVFSFDPVTHSVSHSVTNFKYQETLENIRKHLKTIVHSVPKLRKTDYEPNKDFSLIRSGGYRFEELRKTKNT